jgi:aspartokinase/homoserine dehydrogenase 1
MKKMKVMKFGGSSVANGNLIKNVADIVINENQIEHVALVLSAMKGVTDGLINASREASKRNHEYMLAIEQIKKKHTEAIEFLIPSPSSHKTDAHEKISLMIKELEEILHGVELVKECSPRSLDFIVSFGEKMSCTVMTAYLNSIGHAAIYTDTSEQVIITNNQHCNAQVNFAESYQNIHSKIGQLKEIPVITGFIGSTSDGVTTTIGRNGSDYTASIIGAGVDASVIEIWTDVDGVLSADPRFVKNAFVIPELSVQEAMELSYFGAKVIHPFTMIPAVEKNLNILIKNTFNPKAPGTLIANTVKRHPTFITGIASIDDVNIINVEGGGMIGMPGIAAKILGEIAKDEIDVIMISQASSEHSICLAFKAEDAKKAFENLKRTLADEISNKRIQNLELKKELMIVAVIGENMRGALGMSGRLFSALGEAQINVLAIAQGSSERNISFVAENKDKEKALNTLHKIFLENKNVVHR